MNSDSSISAEYLLKLARQEGFHRAVVASNIELEDHLSRLDSLKEEGLLDDEGYGALVREWQELGGRGTFLLCALSCYRDEPDDLTDDNETHGLIAPFARRNYYREAVSRLKRVFGKVRERTGLRKRDGRIFCNSRLPEKPIAREAGLGVYGKNSLLLIGGLGSMFVIAGLYLPLELVDKAGETGRKAMETGNGTFSLCKGCNACMDACPTGAIVRPGILNEKLCISYISAREVPIPDYMREKWGKRLYGCQTCQDVCPHNANLLVATDTLRGEIGPSVPLNRILQMDREEVKEMFKGTQMGLSWVSGVAILRNAIIASGNSGDRRLLPLLFRFLESKEKILRESAGWAVRMLK